MLRACAEITAAPRRLSVRAGVNRGRVFAVHLGAPSRRTYTTMGDTTNLAARVMGKAPPGAVLATRAALARTRGAFDLEWLEPFNVKGKSMLIEAAIVGGGESHERDAVTGDAAARDADPPPGRDEEVMALASALDNAVAGRGGSLELRGEAGLGKSRLVAHVRELARQRGMATMSIQGGAYGRHSAYLALVAPLRLLIGVARDAPESDVEVALSAAVAAHAQGAPDATGLLGPLVGLELPLSDRVARLDAESQRRRRHLVAAELVASLLSGSPALVVAEDTQWLDDASAELVRSLSVALSDAGSVVVCARRPPDPAEAPPAPHTRVIDVGPLPDIAARRMVLAAVDVEGALPPDAIDGIVARAAGNPLILLELIALVRAGGSVDEMPEGVEAIMAVRIDSIPPADRASLRRLAVLGRWVPTPVAARFLELSAEQLTGLVTRLRDFVEPEPGALVFRHDLVRAAAYEALPFRDRRELHGRAADVLQGESAAGAGSVELLALHAHRAGRDANTWEWGREGAAKALSRGAPSDAVTLFGWAIEAGGRLTSISRRERGVTMEAQGEAAEIAGRYGQAEAAYAAARAERKGEPLAIAELCRKQARMCERRGRYSLALGWATRGRNALDQAPPGLQRDAVGGRLDDVSGVARLRQGRAKLAIRHLEAAVSRLEPTPDRAALAHASYGLAGALVETGRLAAAEALSQRALSLYEEVGDLVGSSAVLNNLGVDAYWVGEWIAASEYLERAASLRREMGDVVFAAESELNLAELWSDQGRWADAEPLLRDALSIFRAAPRPEGIGLALSDLGRLAARTGDHAAATRLLDEALDQLDRIGADGLAYECRVRQAESAMLAGDPAAALAAVAAAEALAPKVDASHFYGATVERTRGWALAMQGHIDESLAAFDRALAHATELGSGYEEEVARDGAQTVAEHAGTADRNRRDEIDAALNALGVVALARPALTTPYV
jgi:tetratricopeptide (TPR) repeat protein